MSAKNNRSVLGNNPLGGGLSRGIFSKTENLKDESELQFPTDQVKKDSLIENQEKQNQESSFLNEAEKEKVNLRLPIEINDWLDELVKKGKRNHGHKIPKEIWVQAALEFFQAMPVDWFNVATIEALKEELKNQENRINNQ